MVNKSSRAKAFMRVCEVSNAFMTEMKLPQLLDLIVEKIATETGADRGSLMLLDRESQELSISAAIGLPAEVVEKTRVKLGQGIAGWVAKRQQPLVLSRRKHPIAEIQEAMTNEQIHSALCVPMMARGELVGVLSVSRMKEAVPFTQSDLELASILGEQAAIAVQNARLYEQIARQQRIMEQLRSRTIQAEENERKVVALEIHDVISQAIASLFYRIQTCERLIGIDVERAQREFSDVKRIAQDTLDDVTRLMFNLRPPVLDDLGVFPALRRYLDQYQRQNGIAVKMTTKGRRRRFQASVELTIYRIVQEALANVRKHAEAKRVIMKFETNRDTIKGMIEDDGKGFDSRSLPRKEVEGHLGLFSMRERAALLGGTLEVRSQSGEGTSVYFEIPAAPRESAREEIDEPDSRAAS